VAIGCRNYAVLLATIGLWTLAGLKCQPDGWKLANYPYEDSTENDISLLIPV